MALRQRGKNGYYHAYFRTVIAGRDGKLHYATRTVNLGTDDAIEAKALEAELMKKNRAARLHQRAKAAMLRLEAEAGLIAPKSIPAAPAPEQPRKRKRVQLQGAFELAEKYRPISAYGRRIFSAFMNNISQKYFDEITPEVAFHYLSSRYGSQSGKAYNNNLTALNRVFKLLLFETGMAESPFAKIPIRQDTPRHQRAFTEAECRRIMAEAKEPWKTAFTISYYTGLRQKDAFALRWSDIDGDLITVTPAKTSRFKRAVRLRVPRQLLDYLASLPRPGNRVLDFAPHYNPRNTKQTLYFGNLLARLEITAAADEIVNYNSIRNTYISRLVEHGVEVKLIGGAVGHKEEEQTILYNTSAIPASKIAEIWKD